MGWPCTFPWPQSHSQTLPRQAAQWGGGLVTRDMEALLLPSHRGSLQAELCGLVMPTRP